MTFINDRQFESLEEMTHFAMEVAQAAELADRNRQEAEERQRRDEQMSAFKIALQRDLGANVFNTLHSSTSYQGIDPLKWYTYEGEDGETILEPYLLFEYNQKAFMLTYAYHSNYVSAIRHLHLKHDQGEIAITVLCQKNSPDRNAIQLLTNLYAYNSTIS